MFLKQFFSGMENIIINKLVYLKKAGYIQHASIDALNIYNVELLELGKRLRAQIEKQLNFSSTAETTCSKKCNTKETDLRFMFTKVFYDNIKSLSVLNQIKTKLIGQNLLFPHSNPIKFKSKGSGSTQLITDHIFYEHCGLTKLYKIQRERKIWWMRYSSNPSRYYLEPYKFPPNAAPIPNVQSTSLKTRLCCGDVCVENITLVPLNDIKLEEKENLGISNIRADKNLLPTVIRSVIDLDVATCALIFDGLTKRPGSGTFFINRKLAPFQCQVIIEPGARISELQVLSKHISNVLIRAGLRIFGSDDERIECIIDKKTLHADLLGIPYIIFVNDDSLNTGLLKLRSRDTTLKETIHISDIPNYLLSFLR